MVDELEIPFVARECDESDVTDCGIFSRKSSASTDSISLKQFFTSLSMSLNWYGGQAMLSVEKNPYRSCRLCIDWHINDKWWPRRVASERCK